MDFDINKVGPAVESDGGFRLGIYLPNITKDDGYEIRARIIHERDQFDPGIEPAVVALEFQGGAYGLWQYEGKLEEIPKDIPNKGRMGQEGRYCYRYECWHNGELVVPIFSDPFCRHSAQGMLSAFHYPVLPAYQWTDGDFKVPAIDDLIVYELMVYEFNRDFDGVIEFLPYLKGLGVNCIELMPVTNIREPFRWGYMPLSHFAIEERYGGEEKLKPLVDTCHREGIAVIHDAVYAHASWDFPFNKVYKLARKDNPMMGEFCEKMFGEGPDFNQPFTQAYFSAVNDYFIHELHMDGFRYDYVPGFYDGPTGQGYARLVYETYGKSKGISRFMDDTGDAGEDSHSRIIQVAEYLEKPREILKETFSSSSKRWWLMQKAEDMIQDMDNPAVSEAFIHDILLMDASDIGWVDENPHAGFPVAPLQFIESHDRSRLMYRLASAIFRRKGWFQSHEQWREGGLDLLSDMDDNQIPDRFEEWQRNWYRLQPFAIALMTAKGVPLIWQGQEFGEYYGLPDSGDLRVLAARPLHWDLFYEKGGRTLVRLYRALAALRHGQPALRGRKHIFYQRESNLNEGLVAYRRDPDGAGSKVMVLINFGPNDRASLSVPFATGRWIEQINHANTSSASEVIESDADDRIFTVELPSFYGKIFVSDS
uniref:1,4-alpha-glucan branching enzyme n=1 Tax=Candidatus Kentrum sp. MB TaxID=2138164 RepID=A0A451BEJ0_9GAMM|nr:MAG: 1,4-alpha-glucan branching enzyme [Candidatus Kentron sp. MB]VFK76693.1 MAG: 1,4-alpha-glucan branching enzyme [Candidatus Kentron sp. MB]